VDTSALKEEEEEEEEEERRRGRAKLPTLAGSDRDNVPCVRHRRHQPTQLRNNQYVRAEAAHGHDDGQPTI